MAVDSTPLEIKIISQLILVMREVLIFPLGRNALTRVNWFFLRKIDDSLSWYTHRRNKS